MVFWVYLAALAILILGYLIKVNTAMSSTPAEAKSASPRRWTVQEIKETYAKVKEKPLDFTPYLPPKLDRRYIVVGASGLVGGQLVLQLLKRGQRPESIRMLDFRKPQRDDMRVHPVTLVDFVQTDITNSESVSAAFTKSWPPSVARSSLTVFHTAAVIRPGERSKLVYDRCRRVNVDGTRNVLEAAKAAGCDIFIATSSASIALRSIKFWNAPWKYYPDHFFQVLDESDAYRPMRDHYDYFGNYAASKAHAERFVMAEGSKSEEFRTGCIRPANGVYGNKYDQTLGAYLGVEEVVTWMAHGVQNFVSTHHIAMAHLRYESALVSPHWRNVTGKTFTITDPNPPITFGDLCNLISTLAVTPFRVTHVPPVPMLLLAHVIEAYCLALVRFPVLRRLGLSESKGDVSSLQPSLFTICTHLVAVDEAARRPVEQSGLGYKGVYTTLECMCDELRAWNEEHQGAVRGKRRRDSAARLLREELRSIASAGVGVKA